MKNQPQRSTLGSPSFRRHADLPAEETKPKADQPTVRHNKYAAPCVNCGVRVEAEQGRLEKNGSKWEVSHIPPCPEVSEIKGQDEPTVERQVNVVNGETLYDGVYTLTTTDGHRTFRLRTQGVDLDFMPGVQLIQHLVGADNDSDYVGFGHIKGDRLFVWKRHRDNAPLVMDAQAFMDDPHGEQVLQSINCYACGRTLTVPESVYNGYGPECAKKYL